MKNVEPSYDRPGSELLESIKEWSRLHDLNESVIAEKGTPSDSEIDFEVEAWSKIEKVASDLVTRKSVEDIIAAKVAEAKAELKARFVALCKDYAEDAGPATSYRQAMEDLVEALENGDENLMQPEPFEALYVENDEVAELGEFLFQSEYQEDAKRLAYPKKHFERMATEVLAYFKDNNPDADAYREKFLAADERAVKWRNQSEAMRLRCEGNEKLLETVADVLMPFARNEAFIPAGYLDDNQIDYLNNHTAGEYRRASHVLKEVQKALTQKSGS
ncbi:hypothetical protein [Mesorhizobium sp. SP-1A]|uniref:hypothetical protein n=1 Tax=Mesorhizobium sp. SP-1A TaxID=3077840 RepID=UPI0028F6CE24|nr:hypothetical protein [Mesorhizobium sp. SP-1A]